LSGLDESSSKIWKLVSHSLCVTIMGVTVKTIWALVGWALKTFPWLSDIIVPNLVAMMQTYLIDFLTEISPPGNLFPVVRNQKLISSSKI